MKRLVAIGAVLTTTFVGLVTVPRSVGASASSPTAPAIAWGTCANPALTAAHAQCGFVGVPADPRHPDGAKILLAVSRVAHTAPDSEYQGAIVTLPGGPGGSGLELATLGEFVPDGVGARYDWIGFDPRGVGSSWPALSCQPDYMGGNRPPYAPKTPAILQQWLQRSKGYADACAARASALLPHMTTSNTARDVDSIRAALGVEQISLYGISYGTYVAQVYATMFPRHVRRMVFDSSVDPRHVWYQTSIDQDIAIERNIKIWFGWLAKYDAVYHLGTTEAEVERLFYQQVAALTREPAGGVIGPDEWEDVFYGAAYTQGPWTFFGALFSSWVHDHESAVLVAAYEETDTPGDDNAFAVYNAVACTDAPVPKLNAWLRGNAETYPVARFATWNNAWYNGPCQYWSAPARERVDVRGDHLSALLIDETLDAAAPFAGSLEVRKRFPRSSLVAEPGGTTHAGALFGNECVDGHIADYLATGVLPPRRPGRGADAACAPFPQPVPDGAGSARLAGHTRVPHAGRAYDQAWSYSVSGP